MLARRPLDHRSGTAPKRLSKDRTEARRDPAVSRAHRPILLDRSLELLPLFRLSDSADDAAVSYSPGPPLPAGSRWRVLPAPNDRIPGTFDQDVYVELMHRYHEAGAPADGTITFTLHAFLRSMGRRVDGRTYEQLRSALNRLERTVLESTTAYFSAPPGRYIEERLTILTSVAIDRRRSVDRDQFGLFPALTSHEPGEARVTLAPLMRANIAAGWTVPVSASRYFSLASPMARRLYRLLSAVRGGKDEDVEKGDTRGGGRGPVGGVSPPVGEGVGRSRPPGGGGMTWDVALEALAEQLPLSQRYPSHLLRVLEPAHALLKAAGLVREASVRQQGRVWFVHYELP